MSWGYALGQCLAYVLVFVLIEGAQRTSAYFADRKEKRHWKTAIKKVRRKRK